MKVTIGMDYELVVDGKITHIDQTKDVSTTTTPFLVRGFGIDKSFYYGGVETKSFAVFQSQGDKCKMLDDINVGDKVQVHFGVNAKITPSDKVAKSEKNPEGLGGFNNLNAYEVILIERGSTPVVYTNTQHQPNQAAIEAAGADITKDDSPF